MYFRNLSLICSLGFIAQACATLADENDSNGTADWLVMSGAADNECNVTLNAASITALGESQCSFDATVDLSEDVRDYQEVQLLLHIGAGDWSAFSSDAEISGAPDGFRRFLFHIENFTCDSVEFIPFYSTVEEGEAGYVWDHNRIGASGTTAEYYKLSMDKDRIHKLSLDRIDASNICQLRNSDRESIVQLGIEPQAAGVGPTATMIGADVGANLPAAPTGVSAAESPDCTLFADPPQQNGSGLITGVGHRALCTSPRNVTVRIRKDISLFPDDTVAEVTMPNVTNIDLGVGWHCSFGDGGRLFTEILDGAGGKASSQRRNLICPP